MNRMEIPLSCEYTVQIRIYNAVTSCADNGVTVVLMITRYPYNTDVYRNRCTHSRKEELRFFSVENRFPTMYKTTLKMTWKLELDCIFSLVLSPRNIFKRATAFCKLYPARYDSFSFSTILHSQIPYSCIQRLHHLWRCPVADHVEK